MYRTLEMALELFNSARKLPDIARERRVAAYEVTGPTTVYVRAGHSRVTVRRTTDRRVQVEADLRQAFGWQWTTERDEAGIYVVLKRKPLVGSLSTAELTLIVPPDAYLVFHLTPGSVQLEDFEGRLAVAPLEAAAAGEPVGVVPAAEAIP
ncbi:MAG: hypothetical protein JW910_17825 [Anaerolineae bacterium]|nr:hypothetical protein [Anaerolineae bacterium]